MGLLPRVKIYFQNGNIGSVVPSMDGLLGIICSGIAVGDTFKLHKPYILNSFAGLAALGVTETNNAGLVKLLREFYAEAGDGTRVYIMAVSEAVSMTDMLDYTKPSNAKLLIETAKGDIKGIICSHTPAAGYLPAITDGINSDVYTAIAKGQELAEWATDSLYAPVFVVIESRDYQGTATDLRDLREQSDNRVCVLVGDTVPGTVFVDAGTNKELNGAAVGLLAGRIAKSPVQRNIGRVKDGAVNSLTAYILDTPAELADVESLHAKGFISFRTFTGRSGYFFTDDPMATLATDDYCFLTRRRTIDKAYRITYDTLLNELLDEIPVNSEGKITADRLKSWQGQVENAISQQMTAAGELSTDEADPNDRGVKCFIDEDQNIVATNKIEVTIKVRPFGYAKYIDAYLGFGLIND